MGLMHKVLQEPVDVSSNRSLMHKALKIQETSQIVDALINENSMSETSDNKASLLGSKVQKLEKTYKSIFQLCELTVEYLGLKHFVLLLPDHAQENYIMLYGFGLDPTSRKKMFFSNAQLQEHFQDNNNAITINFVKNEDKLCNKFSRSQWDSFEKIAEIAIRNDDIILGVILIPILHDNTYELSYMEMAMNIVVPELQNRIYNKRAKLFEYSPAAIIFSDKNELVNAKPQLLFSLKLNVFVDQICDAIPNVYRDIMVKEITNIFGQALIHIALVSLDLSNEVIHIAVINPDSPVSIVFSGLTDLINSVFPDINPDSLISAGLHG